MQRLQLDIARGVLRLLKPGGVLVYSTCSLEPEENEVVANRLINDLLDPNLGRSVVSLPFRDRCDGAFAAKMTVGAVKTVS